MTTRHIFLRAALVVACVMQSALLTLAGDDLVREHFDAPPQSARPGVYWFFMDGNLTHEGMKADLDAMSRAGLARAIAMEADLGGPKGAVSYLTDDWLKAWQDASEYAKSLNIELTASVGPGWCGAGGPWILPENSMQILRASQTRVQGGRRLELTLAVPEPKTPYFGLGSLGPCKEQWENFYRDVAVIAYPTPESDEKIPDWEEKSLVYRHTYSSRPGVLPFFTSSADDPETVVRLKNAIVPFKDIVVLTDKMDHNGVLHWDAPEGNWTILRLGRRITGQTTRPAPLAGLGLECDKFEKTGIEQHFQNFDQKLLDVASFNYIHHDSWEMSSQNWSENFPQLFYEKRGYDPIKWTPVMFGVPVQSVEQSERFLWDLRRTAQELVYENNVLHMKRLAAERGLRFSEEAYDLNPAGDLYLFRAADVPMCEFWAKGYGIDSSFSVFEAVSAAHIGGKNIVGAESFTTHLDKWRQHPGIAKRQGDWAFCAGINRLFFHRMCAQPNDDAPGLSLGSHGTHFDRTQTWFPLVRSYCDYIARVQALLQLGAPSADVLFLDQENAPCVFEAPSSAFLPGEFKDKRQYNFDACDPDSLIEDATVVDGRITFPGGASYALLVLPNAKRMTPRLASKLLDLLDKGAHVLGVLPERSYSLVDYPQNDQELQALVARIKSNPNFSQLSLSDAKSDANRPEKLIKGAQWIWSDSNWNSEQAYVSKRFVKKFQLPTKLDDVLQEPLLVATADNHYRAFLNGKLVLEGDNFHRVDVALLTSQLQPGENTVVLDVLNEGDAPNPAGVIAALKVNDSIIINTDESWDVVDENLATVKHALALGPFNMSPWGLNVDNIVNHDANYPTWSVIERELQSLKLVPDFQSDSDLRWIRRITSDQDVYFVANRLDRPQLANCRFRVQGKSAQLWNPVTGKKYRVDNATEENDQTVIPILFDQSESWFVIFGRSDEEAVDALASNLLKQKDSHTALDLSRQWQATICQNASSHRDFPNGRERTLQFETLQDLSKSADPDVKYYSGLITYVKEFDLPEGFELNDSGVLTLEFEQLEVMAQVKLNGRDLGTIWLKPYRIETPKDALLTKGNRLEIVVANLWCNRLIGDASLPVEERFTRTSNPMWTPGDDQLLPSGIIGKVKLVRTVEKQ
ncbi:MAG: glycosyl hydrolase [Planctomycetia bacterium]|nr:glycosyl hydrolase [Planctomycetia bacterium]